MLRILVGTVVNLWSQMLSRSPRHPVSDDSRQDATAAVQPYSEMQKSMMDELDRRRHDWEKEMHRMQEDFFKVSATVHASLTAVFRRQN